MMKKETICRYRYASISVRIKDTKEELEYSMNDGKDIWTNNLKYIENNIHNVVDDINFKVYEYLFLIIRNSQDMIYTDISRDISEIEYLNDLESIKK